MNQKPTNIATRRGRPGYTLMEMLAALPIILIALDVGGHSLHAIFTHARQDDQYETHASQVDSVSARLRSDAWQAQTIFVDSPEMCTFHTGTRKIVWQMDAAGVLIRTEGELAMTRWPDVALHWQFAKRSEGLCVSDVSTPEQPPVLLYSQSIVAGGRP